MKIFMAGVPNRPVIPPRGGILGFRGNRDHRLADSDCWDIDLLVHLAKVISLIALITNNTLFYCIMSCIILNTSFESDNLGKWE